MQPPKWLNPHKWRYIATFIIEVRSNHPDIVFAEEKMRDFCQCLDDLAFWRFGIARAPAQYQMIRPNANSHSDLVFCVMIRYAARVITMHTRSCVHAQTFTFGISACMLFGLHYIHMHVHIVCFVCLHCDLSSNSSCSRLHANSTIAACSLVVK